MGGADGVRYREGYAPHKPTRAPAANDFYEFSASFCASQSM